MILRAGLLWAANPAAAGQGVRYQGDPRHFSSFGLVALWDTSVPGSKTLNVNDVSAVASLVAGGFDLSQAAGANQPLGVGSPQYGAFASIQFTAANSDRLFATNANVLGTGPFTYVSVQKFGAVHDVYFANGIGVGTGAVLRSSGSYSLQNLGGGGRTFTGGAGLPDATTLHVVINGQDAGEVNGLLWFDALPRSVAPSGTVGADAGATAQLAIGGSAGASLFSDMDWCYGALFQGFVTAEVAYRLSKAPMARAGIGG